VNNEDRPLSEIKLVNCKQIEVRKNLSIIIMTLVER